MRQGRLIFRRCESQNAGSVGRLGGIITWVALAVVDDDFLEVEGRHALQASNIDAELVRVRAPLVMRVDPADGAEMVLGGHGVEAIGCELVLARRDPEGVGS